MILSKMSVLSNLPVAQAEEDFSKKLKRKLVDENPLREIDYGDLLRRFLQKIRIFFSKTDDKIFGWTQRLKENSQKKKIREDGDYWDKIKRDTR
jgi:hypothetical protein